jgi:hypothetical protein
MMSAVVLETCWGDNVIYILQNKKLGASSWSQKLVYSTECSVWSLTAWPFWSIWYCKRRTDIHQWLLVSGLAPYATRREYNVPASRCLRPQVKLFGGTCSYAHCRGCSLRSSSLSCAVSLSVGQQTVSPSTPFTWGWQQIHSWNRSDSVEYRQWANTATGWS